MDTLHLLDELNELAVVKPKQIIGQLTYGLNKDEVSMLIIKVRSSLPGEFKVAAQMVRESDRIVETAKEDASLSLDNAKKEAARLVEQAKVEADLIIQQAKLEQERMTSESEILKISKAQSEEVRNAAERDALQLKRNSEEYAHNILQHLGTVTEKVLNVIEKGKQEVSSPLKEAPIPKERIRV